MRDSFFVLHVTTYLTIVGCAKGHDNAGPVKDNTEEAFNHRKGPTTTSSKEPCMDPDDGEESVYYNAMSDLPGTPPPENTTQNSPATSNSPSAKGQLSQNNQSNRIPPDQDDETSQSLQLSQETMALVRSKANALVGGVEDVQTPPRPDALKEGKRVLGLANKRKQYSSHPLRHDNAQKAHAFLNDTRYSG